MLDMETTGLLKADSAKLGSTDWRSTDAFTKSLKGVAVKIWQAYARYRFERADGQIISKLSDRLLVDIGITRQEAEELDRRR
jgi:uncharacterized protein YjiS (DUF1127 family)